ncbi:C39 family peptidase [Nocardioides sp. SYSU DS0663]|uniref:C39 family peptidase n=1 Tax=Nocardioides sp. SYSU DS0663 TaxID=3416445 RepID=UPI003F4B983B
MPTARPSRPRTVALVGLAVLLAAAPFVPHGGDRPDGALTPTTRTEEAVPAATAGTGRVTPELAAEIERVVAAGRGISTGQGAAPRRTARAAADLVRCADLEGQRYCLGLGWTSAGEQEVRARAAAAARRSTAGRSRAVERTGDLDSAALLARRAAMTPAERARDERRELTMAARSVAKVWLLRHEVEGTPLPAGFLERHPEARTAAPATARRSKTQADYPRRRVILDTDQVAEQKRTYWCGPATMQMIAWGWKDKDRGQRHWADKLGTTSQGTSITDLVRVVNDHTGWDRRRYAGPYVVLDVSDYGFNRWMRLQMRHLVDYRAPVVLHPLLHRRYFPYLDDDASGHFQVGRGYSKRGPKPTAISFFEPWNQQRFDPSEPFIKRVQWRTAYKSYRANLAHPHQNIGV